jgi:hypothetical protein
MWLFVMFVLPPAMAFNLYAFLRFSRELNRANSRSRGVEGVHALRDQS